LTPPPRIVAIVLVRNEDRFLHRAITNVAEFCDEILIADHRSADGTWEIAQELSRTLPHVHAHRIQDARESNAMIAPFAGTPTWIFGVDGDEIYDPAGLARLRAQLFAGKFDPWWVVFGNVLNCTALDPVAGSARGYLAPPCRSMTKLYNFRMLRELDPTAPQRLHSHKGRDVFHEGSHHMLRYDLYKETTWEAADFRCLHTCFLPRSSAETNTPAARENVSESLQPLRQIKRLTRAMFGRKSASDYKRDKYMRGPEVTVDATPFFP
jgi:glycosyltransferase involved in cell wall biosynthesis